MASDGAEGKKTRIFVGNLHQVRRLSCNQQLYVLHCPYLDQDVSEDLIAEAFGYVGPVEDVRIVWEHDSSEPTPFAFVTVREGGGENFGLRNLEVAASEQQVFNQINLQECGAESSAFRILMKKVSSRRRMLAAVCHYICILRLFCLCRIV